MMINLSSLTAAVLLCSAAAFADTAAFHGIRGDAADIKRDAEALSRDLKARALDEAKIKGDIEALGKDIAALRKDIEAVDAAASGLTPGQKKDWEMVRTKAQLLTIFYDRKAELLSMDNWQKNRSMLRAHADGIAKRAGMLQDTVQRLD